MKRPKGFVLSVDFQKTNLVCYLCAHSLKDCLNCPKGCRKDAKKISDWLKEEK